MDFYSMYKKKAKSNEQSEDYLTELLAFMLRISPEFKEEYFTLLISKLKEKNGEDLNLNLKKLVIKTQNKVKNCRPDLVFCQDDSPKIICEHKIFSRLGENKNINQLDSYFEEFNDIKDAKYFFLWHSKKNIISDDFKSKKNWIFITWEEYFIQLMNKFIPKFYDKTEFEEFDEEINGDYFKTLVYFFLEFLWNNDLENIDLNSYKKKYNGFRELVEKCPESLGAFNEYKSILIELNKGGRGSKLNDFVDNERIYLKVKNGHYIGFYGFLDLEYNLCDWHKEPKNKWQYSNLKKKYADDYQIFQAKNVVEFNEIFEEHRNTLWDIKNLLHYILGDIFGFSNISTKIMGKSKTIEILSNVKDRNKEFKLIVRKEDVKLHYNDRVIMLNLDDSFDEIMETIKKNIE